MLGSTHQQATIGLEMDGVTELLVLNESIAVYPNPRFRMFDDLSFSSRDDIELTVESEVREGEREGGKEGGRKMAAYLDSESGKERLIDLSPSSLPPPLLPSPHSTLHTPHSRIVSSSSQLTWFRCSSLRAAEMSVPASASPSTAATE